jgi:hypothetical protein
MTSTHHETEPPDGKCTSGSASTSDSSHSMQVDANKSSGPSLFPSPDHPASWAVPSLFTMSKEIPVHGHSDRPWHPMNIEDSSIFVGNYQLDHLFQIPRTSGTLFAEPLNSAAQKSTAPLNKLLPATDGSPDSSPLTTPPTTPPCNVTPLPGITLSRASGPYVVPPPKLPSVDLLTGIVGKEVHQNAETVMWPCGWKTILPTAVVDGINVLEAVCIYCLSRTYTEL